MFGDDFPLDLPSFEERFGSEDECRRYLFDLKWPDGFRCPSCGGEKFWWTRKNKLHCASCGHQSSVTVGTVIENSKKPLTLWFKAIFLVAFQKSGVNAKNLQSLLGLGSYLTAWTWLQKIRRSMVRPEREPLGENATVVEVDETYVGGAKPGKRGRGAEGKTPLAFAVETTSQGIGRIRISVIENCGAAQLNGFLTANVKPGASIHTDGWRGYAGAHLQGLAHAVVESTSESLKCLHLVVSLFKRWLLGTHQGAVSKEHLQYYADEFVFRFNRRTSKNRALVVHRLLEQASTTKAQTYKRIIGKA